MRWFALFNRCALILALAFGLAHTASAEPRTLHWSHQKALLSLDPMAFDDPFTRGVQDWYYEALTGFDQDLKLVPMLAESWDKPEPDKWIFHLRKGVSFHDGSPFTADDVIFSWQRSQAGGSAIKEVGAKATGVRKIDDHTIEVTTPRHNPILARDWSRLPIMSKRWTERHEAEQVAGPYTSRHANGTGPFRVARHQPKAETIFERYPAYWDHEMAGNVDMVVYQPMAQDSARTAALLSGKMDIVMPVPLLSVPELENKPAVQVMIQPEARVLFLSLDRRQNQPPHAGDRHGNPLNDKRVRQAISLAIDSHAINQNVMAGRAKPTGTLIAPQVNGYDASFSTPRAFDLELARKLLLDAGYLERFSIRLFCPSGRYMHDQAICRSIVKMLDRINIQADLADPAPMANHSQGPKPSAWYPGLQLQSWAPASLDAGGVLHTLVACRDNSSGAGQLNVGAYCNHEIDSLSHKIATEADQVRRNTMIKEAFSMLRNDVSHLPLHQPPMVWAVRTGITLAQRADNVLDIRSVVMP